MILDKEELLHKRMKSEGGDKDGMKEAILRRKLTSIMTMYGLREHFEDSPSRQKEHDVRENITIVVRYANYPSSMDATYRELPMYQRSWQPFFFFIKLLKIMFVIVDNTYTIFMPYM